MDKIVQYRVNIIGSGRLGSTLGYLLANSEQVIIKGIASRTLLSSQKAVKFIGQGIACETLKELPSADIYFITTSDNAIESSCNELVETNIVTKNAIVVHCSGSLASDILQAAKKIGCATVSIHPIKSFADPARSIKNFNGTFCAYEGDRRACDIISKLFEKIGAITFPINKDKKIIYHAASVFAVNYLMALYKIAEECYQAAEIPPNIAKQIILNLMQGAIENLTQLSPQQALTGPMQRGDHEIIAKHLAALSQHPEYLEIYKVLGKTVLTLTSHSETKKAELLKLLDL